MKSKKILVPVFALVVLLSGALFVVPPAHAQGVTVQSGNFFSGLVNFITQKFGLDKTQVQTAVNDYKAQNKAKITPRPTLSPDQMQAMDKTRLDKLVAEKKITPAQEQAILDELTSLRTKYKFDKSQTADVRKIQMETMQTDLKAFATAQGIDPKYILMFGMGGFNKGHGMRDPGGPRGNWGQKPLLSPTPTQ